MRVLITGITGQDGFYLANQLIGQGYEVFGTIRGQSTKQAIEYSKWINPDRLVWADLLDPLSMVAAVQSVAPDIIYHLAGVTAPEACWRQPTHSSQVNMVATCHLLETIWRYQPEARTVLAASIATHGVYGAQKQFLRNLATDWRSRDLPVYTAVLAGHHSPRRGPEFFTRKVTLAVARIRAGLQKGIFLGPLGRKQDFGWAPNFTKALTEIGTAQDLLPDEYVIATNDPHTNQEWVEAAFNAGMGANWESYVVVDDKFSQPTDVTFLTAEPDSRLKWVPDTNFEGLVEWMVSSDISEWMS